MIPSLMSKTKRLFTLVKLLAGMTLLAITSFGDISFGDACCGTCPQYVNYSNTYWTDGCFFMDGTQDCSGGTKSCYFMACPDRPQPDQFCDGSSCMCITQ